ncbi:MAG: transglutaminase-like cysteine peptidase [Pseudomonadota bacterium]|jgi:predicted transglutaminase-like cysteine proteinase
MLRVIGVLMMAVVYMGASPVSAAELWPDARAASASFSLAAKWQSALRGLADDEARLAACRSDVWTCGDAEIRLEAIVASGRAREGRARIGEINRAVNLAIRPVSDERQFGVADYWSGPLETLASGQGDCEDYAIVKLLALQQAGIARSDLRLVIVRERASRSAHAVAAVRFDGRWLLLDNRFLALVDIEHSHYRVLAQLEPDANVLRFAAIDAVTASAPGIR